MLSSFLSIEHDTDKLNQTNIVYPLKCVQYISNKKLNGAKIITAINALFSTTKYIIIGSINRHYDDLINYLGGAHLL